MIWALMFGNGLISKTKISEIKATIEIEEETSLRQVCLLSVVLGGMEKNRCIKLKHQVNEKIEICQQFILDLDVLKY